MLYLEECLPHIDSPLQEPHPRHASATIATTEREYIPPKPPTRNILPRGSPHKRTPIGHRAGVSAVWDRPGLVIVVHRTACVECTFSIRHRRRCFQGKTMITDYWHVCYDIIDQIYDNYYAYLACRRHEEHALSLVSKISTKRVPVPHT